MFKELYIGELKKSARVKPIIVVCILFIVCFGMSCLIFSLMDSIQEMESTVIEDNPELEKELEDTPFLPEEFMPIVYTPENIDYFIKNAEEAVEQAKKERDEYKPAFFKSNSQIYCAKTFLTYLKFIKENDLYGDKDPLQNPSLLSSETTTEDFLSMFIELWAAVLMIFGIILGANSISQELRNGTLKMMLMRPITRTKLYLAKLASMCSIQTVLFFLPVLLVYAYAGIRYSADQTTYLFIFNASKAYFAGGGYWVLLSLMFNWLGIIVYTSIAYGLGTLIRSNAAAIALTIALNIGIVSQFFGIYGSSVSNGFLAVSLSSLPQFFAAEPSSTYAGNFFISFFVVIAYLALALVSSFLVFRKRDIA